MVFLLAELYISQTPSAFCIFLQNHSKKNVNYVQCRFANRFLLFISLGWGRGSGHCKKNLFKNMQLLRTKLAGKIKFFSLLVVVGCWQISFPFKNRSRHKTFKDSSFDVQLKTSTTLPIETMLLTAHFHYLRY